MATPQLDIARVSFSAVLLRHDPTPCARPDIDEFLAQIDATVSRCSPSNVQKTKQWILKNLVTSQVRVAALAKYLAALAGSFTADIATTRAQRQTSTKRKRLHILYILNDILYHVHIRDGDSSFALKLKPALPGIFGSAAAFPNSPKHVGKIHSLLDTWSKNKYLPDAFIHELSATVQDAPNKLGTELTKKGAANGAVGDAGAKPFKTAPFIMPAMHGDPTVPWYDLPASNWLSVIEPNSTRPMNPDMIKPLQFVPGPADKQLIAAVNDLLVDVDRIYSKDSLISRDTGIEDVDQLGQPIVVDEITGEIIGGETYYGWSREFCEKMKKRRGKHDPGADKSTKEPRGRSRSPSRSTSRSSDRSWSRPAFKRRRTSDSRGRSRSPSYSPNRSSFQRGRRRSLSDSDRSRSPSRSRDIHRQRSNSRSRGHRGSPPRNGPSNSYESRSALNNPAPQLADPRWQQHSQAIPPPPFPVPPEFNHFMGVVPPPPPPNYTGQWPPPPPPPPPFPVASGGGGMPPVWPAGMPPTGGNGWPPAPPPPPPHEDPYGNRDSSQYGRGGGGAGRGDYRGQGSGYQSHRGGWNNHHRGRGW